MILICFPVRSWVGAVTVATTGMDHISMRNVEPTCTRMKSLAWITNSIFSQIDILNVLWVFFYNVFFRFNCFREKDSYQGIDKRHVFVSCGHIVVDV